MSLSSGFGRHTILCVFFFTVNILHFNQNRKTDKKWSKRTVTWLDSNLQHMTMPCLAVHPCGSKKRICTQTDSLHINNQKLLPLTPPRFGACHLVTLLGWWCKHLVDDVYYTIASDDVRYDDVGIVHLYSHFRHFNHERIPVEGLNIAAFKISA